MSDRESEERRELEAAGWDSKERDGEEIWRNPVGGLWYPRDVAVAMVRENAHPELPMGPEGGA